MKDWRRTLIGPEASLKQALQAIDATGGGMALIADADDRLLGVLTDGDIRRALIHGAALAAAALPLCNPAPLTGAPGLGRDGLLALMRRHRLRQLPLVEDGRLAGLATLADYLDIPERPQSVIIMAGGRGERLAELTRATPKPMLRIGPRPILDTIVSSFAEQGFRNIFLAVHYKAEQIEAHFGDGADRGLNIRYLRETRPLGTCGALSLLPPQDGAVVVANGDVLSKEDYGLILDRHLASGADGSVLVRDYEMQVPFGVIDHEGGEIRAIQEKPSRRFTINGGVYVLSPQGLGLLAPDEHCDMPQLLQAMLEAGLRLRAHAAESYWVDIGRMADYERANTDFPAVFGQAGAPATP